MKRYIKWTFYSIILLVLMLGVAVLGDGIPDKSNIRFAIIVILFGSIFLGGMFALIEIKYIPYRKRKLIGKFKKIFNAQVISDNLYKFKYDRYDVFLSLRIQMNIFQPGVYMERIEFHLIRAQVEDMKESFWVKRKESFIGTLKTYMVYGTNNTGLKLGWNRVQKQLDKIKRIKY